jgi:hypothetical protein
VTAWRPVRWLLLAGFALLTVWLVAPHSPPIYDGVGFPDEPYRYVRPPAGDRVKTAEPTVARAAVAAQNGVSLQLAYLGTREQGPQAVIFVPQGGLSGPRDATSYEVALVPEAPSRQPDDGTVDGNVYAVSASAGNGRVQLNKVGMAGSRIQLRATSARQPGPVIEHRVNGRWTALSSIRVGNDVYWTGLPALGEYAVVWRTGRKTATGSGTGRGLVAGVAISLVVVAAAIVAVRVSRSRRSG